MRLAAVVFFALLSFAFARETSKSGQPTRASRLEETLTRLEKESWEAWQKRDGTFFQKFLSDDHVEVGSGGIASKSAIVSYVGSRVCIVRSYAVDNFRLTKVEENTALLTYRAEQDTTCNAKRVPSPAWASSLYVKRGGAWVNVFYQQTPLSVGG